MGDCSKAVGRSGKLAFIYHLGSLRSFGLEAVDLILANVNVVDGRMSLVNFSETWAGKALPIHILSIF